MFSRTSIFPGAMFPGAASGLSFSAQRSIPRLKWSGWLGGLVRLWLAGFFSLLSGALAQPSSGMRVGLARIDITPEKPVTMAGYASRKDVSQGVHDPLSARVVAFEDQGNRLVLISCDIIGFYSGTADPIRQAVLEQCNLKPEALFLAAIHTHAGPNLELPGGSAHPNNVAYTRSLQETLVRLTREALGGLMPVQVGTGMGSAPVGVNRREVVHDRAGNPRVRLGRNPEGVTDPEVQVLNIASMDGALQAVLFAYATHSTCLGPGNYIISGDVHGLAEQCVERYLGVMAPAFAGASGDIDPWFRVLPEFHQEKGWMPEPVLLGTWLGQEVVQVSQRIEATSSKGPIRTAYVTLNLPGKPRGETKATDQAESVPLNVTVGRVGSIGFVGLGAEVLSEVGLAIKAASPFQPTFIITHCNGASGYLPPRHAYLEGGYEVESSPFASGAAEQVVREVRRMLHELSRDRGQPPMDAK